MNFASYTNKPPSRTMSMMLQISRACIVVVSARLLFLRTKLSLKAKSLRARVSRYRKSFFALSTQEPFVYGSSSIRRSVLDCTRKRTTSRKRHKSASKEGQTAQLLFRLISPSSFFLCLGKNFAPQPTRLSEIAQLSSGPLALLK